MRRERRYVSMANDGVRCSRREFLKVAGILGAGSLLPAAAERLVHAAQKGEREAMVVPTRPFGKTGVNVPCLSLGGMFAVPSNQILMHQALRWGVTYWDTAPSYEGGNAEKGIGAFFTKNPEARKKVFLVTKSDSREPDGMTKLFNRSLERMNTTYIDLYFIHGISTIREISDEMKTWAEKMKAAGKLRFFGFSTHSNMEDCLLGAAKLGWIDGIMMTYNYRLMNSDKMKQAVDACTAAGIGLTAMKTQGSWSLRSDSEAELKLTQRFVQRGFTDKQAKLKAVWENPRIASICSQMPNVTILMANAAAAMDKTSLSTEDRGLLQRYAHETASGYCAGCTRICQTALATPVPVGDVMRYLMYYHDYGDRDRARTLFAELPTETRSRLDRVDYSPAEERCPQRIAIGRLMREAGRILA
jgi:predicted aldo/keto reductase-like oxidoreductase